MMLLTEVEVGDLLREMGVIAAIHTRPPLPPSPPLPLPPSPRLSLGNGKQRHVHTSFSL